MYILKAIGGENMLLQFKFSNFRCFFEEVVFDMTATSIKEHRYSLIEKNGVNILPVAAVYGANASGKSSFFMALDRMKSVVIDRYLTQEAIIDNKYNDNKYKAFTNPFMFDEIKSKEPSSYEVSVLINDYEYRYGFVCTNNNIQEEYLYKRKFSKNTTIEKMIFERINNKTIVGKVNQKMKAEIEYCSSMATDRILLLTDIGLRGKEKELNSIFSWFLSISVYQSSANDAMTFRGFSESLVGDILKKEIDPIFREKYISLICEVDPSISTITVVEEQDSDGNKINIAKSVHKIGDKEYTIPFSVESEGTNKLFFLSLILLITLARGYAIFIDELDSKLHPLILRKIVQMFTNKETNPRGAQLIFSAHNIINLDSSDLRRDEIWFIEKENHKSSMYSLVDFDDGGIRSDLSYGKHYLAGRFGAVPFQDEE